MPAGVTYEPIATTTLTGTSTAITFSSISSSYTDLKVILVYTLDAAARNFGIRFNSDTGTSYSRTTLTGDGTSATSFRQTAQVRIILNEYGGDSTTPATAQIDIFSYTGSTFKSILSINSCDNNGSGETNQTVGMWRSTSAITDVVLVSLNSNFKSGTTATLYGITKA